MLSTFPTLGLSSLALAITTRHKLQERAESSAQEVRNGSRQSNANILKEDKDELASPLPILKSDEVPVEKTKVASLIQRAKPELTRQAEEAFDVNSFNF